MAVAQNAKNLAEIETRDNGKVLLEMQEQLKVNPEYRCYYGDLADKIEGSVMPVEKADVFAFNTHEVVGVVAALTAWNSPLQFQALKCAPALAAECAAVVRPSESASASSLEFAALAKEAGLPDGGQMCIAGSRLLVQNSIKEKLTERLVMLARDLRLDDPMHPTTNYRRVRTNTRP